MKALTCEMCGSTNLIKEEGVFICKSCGTKYSVEEAKKLMIEGTVDVKGTVKVDTSDELKNLYEIARRAKDSENNENAAKYYDMILVKNPNSWEANFYTVYFKSISCKIDEIQPAAMDVHNCLKPVLDLVKENITDEVDQLAVIYEIYLKCSHISDMFYNHTVAKYQENKRNNAVKRLTKQPYIFNERIFDQEYIYNVGASKSIMYNLGDLLVLNFGDKYGSIAAKAWKQGIDQHKTYVKLVSQKQDNIDMIYKYVTKVTKYEPSYQTPSINTGCYVATAVYGSYDCPEVWTLRRFRDDTLASTWYGMAFIKTYYATSPTLVKWFGNTAWFKNICRKPLDKFVHLLKNRGVNDTPYKDRSY